MFYLVEIECIDIASTYKYKQIIYTKTPEIAKKDLYNFYSSVFKLGIIFKTFREATEEETTRYIMDDGERPVNHSYVTICSIV